MSDQSLPAPAAILREALGSAQGAKHMGTLNTDGWLAHGRLMLDIARELREGSGRPRVIVTDDVELTAQAVEAARAAFDSREPAQFYDATSHGDRANDQTAIIHVPVYQNVEQARAAGEQPMPVPNDRGSIQALVRQDLVERERVGEQRYGTPLQAFNGRDALRDAYEEALDLACYLRQALAEREATS